MNIGRYRKDCKKVDYLNNAIRDIEKVRNSIIEQYNYDTFQEIYLEYQKTKTQ